MSKRGRIREEHDDESSGPLVELAMHRAKLIVWGAIALLLLALTIHRHI